VVVVGDNKENKNAVYLLPLKRSAFLPPFHLLPNARTAQNNNTGKNKNTNNKNNLRNRPRSWKCTTRCTCRRRIGATGTTFPRRNLRWGGAWTGNRWRKEKEI